MTEKEERPILFRDYFAFNKFVVRLTGDVYGQPTDPGHTAWALHAFDWIRTTIYAEKEMVGQVLDVGCGEAFMCLPFEAIGMNWTGVTIGKDFERAKVVLEELKFDPAKVEEADMTFLPFNDNTFDLVFARHVLEHSPFPIITLMEWRRVTKPGGHLCLVSPAPHWWGVRGKNHYAVVPKQNLEWWLMRSGWHVQHEFNFHNRDPLFLKHLEVYQATGEKALGAYPVGDVEFRFICERGEAFTE